MPADTRLAAFAITALRVALGVMFLAHGLLLKVFVFGLAGTVGFFESVGLPGPLAYLVVIGETLGGLMLVLGYQARWAALALMPVPLGAVWVHAGNGWLFSAAGGGWEYPAYLSLLALVQFLLGDGALALRPSSLPGRSLRAASAGTPGGESAAGR